VAVGGVNRDVTMAEIAEMRPLALLPMGDDEWTLVYPIGVDLRAGAMALSQIFDYVCSAQ
jgi:hypothetical protein